MKGIVVVNKWLVPPMAGGITIFPFIFLRSNQYLTKRVITHERIHLRQQLELLVVPFFVLYILNGIVNIVLMSKPDFYRTILFEKECFANEHDSRYLHTMKWYSWIKYIGKPYIRIGKK
jgi:hypothetical protein